jgi:hypothetical protein
MASAVPRLVGVSQADPNGKVARSGTPQSQRQIVVVRSDALAMFLWLSAQQILSNRLMRSWLAGEAWAATRTKVAAAILDGGNDRLAGKQIVPEIDRPEVSEAGAVPGQPALGGIALAILLLRPSCGAMNSGGRGITWLWPGAARLTPGKACKYSIPHRNGAGLSTDGT